MRIDRWRERLWFLAMALLTIATGLALHWRGQALPPAARDIFGDALWAVMMTWWIGAVVPSVGIRTRGAVAFGVCVAVEFSQLYHTPTIDAVRRTTLGGLVLGSGFDPRDIVAYCLGVALAILLERGVRAWRPSSALSS